MQRLGASSKRSSGLWTTAEAAIHLLRKRLENEVTDASPLMDSASIYSDLLGAALKEVDWCEIAQNWLSEFDDSGAVISVYSRANAIEDGQLIDVSETATEAGIRFPTALTRRVWARFVTVPDGLVGQDEDGRLWDILWMFCVAAKGVSSEQLSFSLYVRNDDENPKLITLEAVVGPGDDATPVITIMLPNES